MYSKLKYLIIIQAILLSSCGVNEEQKQEILKTHIQKLGDPRVKNFDITDCIEDCHKESGRLISQTLDSNILKLEISHWMNCATSIKHNVAGFEYKNGVLNLLIESIPERVDIEPNGDTNFVYEATACTCYFVFNFELSGFDSVPDSILINNNSINNHGMLFEMFDGLIEEIDSNYKTD
ncbi:MAG: hypothetical protein COB15_12120 [Flavobacteriales bacterium]|nr:MAG: hypothetical protein COB15_12120 [Flavobacteriales bacterium]